LELSAQAIGRAGEFQAAAIFEQHGVVTSHVDIHGVDLWVETPSGRRVTVQVKTSTQPRTSGRHVTPRYFFHTAYSKTHSADAFCFVALDLGLLRLLSTAEVGTLTRKVYPQVAFTDAAMAEDIKRYLY
jgi:hypothetical protein